MHLWLRPVPKIYMWMSGTQQFQVLNFSCYFTKMNNLYVIYSLKGLFFFVFCFCFLVFVFVLPKAKINLSLANVLVSWSVNPGPHDHLKCLVSLDRGQACWDFSVPTARRWPHDLTSSLKWSLLSVHKMKWLSMVTVISSDGLSCRKWLYQNWKGKNCVAYADFLQTDILYMVQFPHSLRLTSLELYIAQDGLKLSPWPELALNLRHCSCLRPP